MIENTYIVETCDGNATILQGRNKKHVIQKFRTQERFYTVSDITSISRVDVTMLLESYFLENERNCFVV